MTKTQEQLRQEGLRAARNMVRKYKARHKDNRENTMTNAQDWERRRKRWAEYEARVAKRKADKANADKAEAPTGDGPSGFDYWHDTHRHC